MWNSRKLSHTKHFWIGGGPTALSRMANIIPFIKSQNAQRKNQVVTKANNHAVLKRIRNNLQIVYRIITFYI